MASDDISESTTACEHKNVHCKAFHSFQFSSVAQLFPTLWLHGLQHARRPCPLPTLRAYLNSCPSSWWCHPIISSSVIPLFSCLQPLPASGSFPVSRFFASGGQCWSFSFSISPSSEYSGLISFRIDWLDLLAVQGTLKSFQHHSLKTLALSLLYGPSLTSVHAYWKKP